MTDKYRRHFLKPKETKAILDKASEKLKAYLEPVLEAKVNIEVIETEFAQVLLAYDRPILVKSGENIFPTLLFNEFLATAPKVVIDMGAVPHICSGANVMAPGIVRYEGEFRSGGFVLVIDEKHRKPLAIGETMCDSDAAKRTSQGVIIRNVHYVGDRIWEFLKRLSTRG